jgi:AraC family transcriptional regulator
MGDLVTPDDLPKWVPGEVTVDSAPLGWQGLRVRGYRSPGCAHSRHA